MFDGIFTAVTQHDGKFLAVDDFSFFDGKFLAIDGKSIFDGIFTCLLYTSPSPRDKRQSRMPSSA